jgi:V/A-type H+-transporting ATPase subunit A
LVHAIDSRVIAVNGPLVTAEVIRDQEVTMNEVAYVVWNGTPLKSEVIRIRGRLVDLQVFESTTGLKVGDQVSFTRELLSATLGPGILGQIYDGLQNPLNMLENSQGFFLKRGQYVSSLDNTKKWDFTPSAAVGEHVKAGYYLGYVKEGIFQHHIIVPLSYTGVGEIVEIAGEVLTRSTSLLQRSETRMGNAFRLPWNRNGLSKCLSELTRRGFCPTAPF